MLSYLLASGMQDTYQALARESGVTDFDAADPKARWVGLLEKKWTSVIRLQKKVCAQSASGPLGRRRRRTTRR